MIKRFIKAWHSSVLLLKLGGPGVFLRQLGRQFYSKSVHIGLELNLQEVDVPLIEARIKYSVGLASEQDMNEVLQKAKTESKKSAKQLVTDCWLYADGYHNCYLARSADTNELCFMQFIIYPDDDKIVKGTFRNWFPKLNEDEAIIEGAYTFEKYRGNKLHPAITTDQLRICKEKGFKRMIAHVEKDNETSLKGSKRAGYTEFEKRYKLRILSMQWQKHIPLHG